MDYKVIINLMKEMNRTDLTKLEIEEEGTRICMEKAANTVMVSRQAEPYAMLSAGQMNMLQPEFMGQSEQVPQMNQSGNPMGQTAADLKEKPSEEENYKKITSPMVGTFYASPSPDKPAFVKVGDMVKKGQTVCIIEAMKLLNEIESEQDGEIVKILVNNEEMVEFGQPMFLVK